MNYTNGKQHLLKHVDPKDRIVVSIILDTIIEDVEGLSKIAYKKELLALQQKHGLIEVLNEIQS